MEGGRFLSLMKGCASCEKSVIMEGAQRGSTSKTKGLLRRSRLLGVPVHFGGAYLTMFPFREAYHLKKRTMSNEQEKALEPSDARDLSVAALSDDVQKRRREVRMRNYWINGVQKWRRVVRMRKWIAGLFFGGLACDFLVLLLMGVFPAMQDQPVVVGAMCALTVCWFSACCVSILFPSLLDTHIQETFQSKDVSHLGCWIYILFSPLSPGGFLHQTKRYHAEARSNLLEQLPLLTEETASLLRNDERHALYKTLYGKDEELIFAVLRVTPILCDARALPFVRHLAEGKGWAATNAELQMEAQSALSRLQAGLALSSGSQGLLRASQPPHASKEELLIPAHANSDTEAQELMRANIQE